MLLFSQSRIEELKSFLNQKGMLHLSCSVVTSISKQLKGNYVLTLSFSGEPSPPYMPSFNYYSMRACQT